MGKLRAALIRWLAGGNTVILNAIFRVFLLAYAVTFALIFAGAAASLLP